MASHQPWQSYINTKDAIYLKDDHIMILHDQESDHYWLADLDDFYDVFYRDALGCEKPDRATPCSPVRDLKEAYVVDGATFSVKNGTLNVIIANFETLQTPEPELYSFESTLDGKNIKIQ